MGKVAYETITTDEADRGNGKSGKSFYRVPWFQILCLGILLLYTTVVFLFLTFVLTQCPSVGPWARVLPSVHLDVNQFYSGLALSLFFTPAALLIRRLAYDIALLHPFALASHTAISLSDLDHLMDPGLVAMGTLFKYSLSRGGAQALLMAVGAFLVPVGTLMIFTGTYSAPTPGTGYVGMPTYWDANMIMDIVMENTSMADASGTDFFLMTGTNVFVGDMISQMGSLRTIASQLGPVATVNLTYVEGTTYTGIVTYHWSSGCVPTTDITFTETSSKYDWVFNLTMPDGTQSDWNDAYDTKLVLSNVSNSANQLESIYYAVMGTEEQTENLDNVTHLTNTGLTFINGAWISRVKCTPSLTWEVSTCTYRNGTMSECVAAPGTNTTRLDNEGLNKLTPYMSAIPLNTMNQGSWTFGYETILLALVFDAHRSTRNYKAPTLDDYDKMYGSIAYSMVKVVTAGYYGVAEVATTGAGLQPVYLVRLQVLLIIAIVLILTPLAPLAIILNSLYFHQAPIWPTTFFTIANAVRGPWWDRILWGTALMSPSEARHALRGLKVKFGTTVDVGGKGISQHVGLAETVVPVQQAGVYY